ncbi:MAG: helix-turn-helix transcriptional regulator [Eubacteriales bacterium]
MSKKFGEFLRKLRMSQRISSLKFAEMTGISPVVLSRMETMGLTPNPKDLLAIQKALNLSENEANVLQTLADESMSGEKRTFPLLPHQDVDRSRLALRVAKEMDFTDKEWKELYHTLPQKSKDEEGET